MSEHDVEAKSSDTNNGSDQASGNSGGCDADTRYIRSLEGITKIVCVVSSIDWLQLFSH